VKAVINGEKDLVISPILPKVVIFIRYHLPTIYFIAMKLRAKAVKNRTSRSN
jgi:hypothetical protein